GVAREGHSSLQIDQSGAHQLGDFAIEILHAVSFVAIYGFKQRFTFVLALLETLAGAAVGFQYLENREPATAIGARDEALGYDEPEGLREAFTDRLLFYGKVGTDDALDGFGGVDRVHCRQHDQPHIGGFENHLDSFAVAHFADEDYLGRLAQRGAKGQGKVGCVAVQFALVNRRALVVVQELDGVFDGDDVVVTLPIDAVEESGEGGTLAGSSRPGDQHDAVAKVGYICEVSGQMQ